MIMRCDWLISQLVHLRWPYSCGARLRHFVLLREWQVRCIRILEHLMRIWCPLDQRFLIGENFRLGKFRRVGGNFISLRYRATCWTASLVGASSMLQCSLLSGGLRSHHASCYSGGDWTSLATCWSTHPVVSTGTPCSRQDSTSIHHWSSSTCCRHVVTAFSSAVGNYRQYVRATLQTIVWWSSLPSCCSWGVECLTTSVPLTTLILLRRNWKLYS